MLQDLNEIPKRISLRSFAFAMEGENVVLAADYWINTVRLDKTGIQKEDGKVQIMRKLIPTTLAKKTLEIPLMSLDNGELIYVKYLDMLDMIRETILKLDGTEDNSATFKEKCQLMIDRDKDAERLAETS